MKNIKRILAIILTAMLAFGLLAPAAQALDNNIHIAAIGGATGYFEFFLNDEWTAIPIPFWFTEETGDPAYCLESSVPQPMGGESYHAVEMDYDVSTLMGIQAILFHGAPNVLGGLTSEKAQYATQIALWSWLYESAGIGYFMYDQSKLYCASGGDDVWDFYLQLMEYARDFATSNLGGATLDPSTITLTDNGSGQLVGTTVYGAVNWNGGYEIDQSKVPEGMTISGVTYQDGDTITVTAPMSYAGQRLTIEKVMILKDSRTVSNLHWYASASGDLQKMVVVNKTAQNVFQGSLIVECAEKSQGKITIQKNNTNPAMGDYSLEGAVFEIFTGSRELIDTVTTDAQGFAQSKLLDYGNYIVNEKTAPQGYVRYATDHGFQLFEEEILHTVPQEPQVGVIRLTKTNANPALGGHSLAGAVFEVKNSSGELVDTLTTDKQGKAQSKQLPLGEYKIKETIAPEGFSLNPDTHSVTLAYGNQNDEVVYADVTVAEQPQAGIIRVTKTNSNPDLGDHSLAGAVFEILDSQGKLVDTITTNNDGKAESKALPFGSYSVKEKTAPQGFVRSTESFSVNLAADGSDEIVYGDVTVPNRPQTGKITVTKKDSSTGTSAWGDATLNGAVFEVYAADKTTLVDTLYTGTGTAATSKELPLSDYYIKEKAAPEGYKLDSELHKVTIAYGDQDTEVVAVNAEVKNDVIAGQISITKFTDQSPEGHYDPQLELPLEGAKFEIYLKSAGSYDSAKETERDILITDAEGRAISKQLPYGIYTVVEVSAPGDVVLVEPFDVIISEDGRVYHYDLNNPTYTTKVKIIKLDSSTGKPIQAAGTGFKIKNIRTGEWVKQGAAEVFETGADGTLILSEPLPSDEYELHEIKAPVGYLLSAKPEPFVVHSSQQQEMITVTMSNVPVKGTITVEKLGEMLASVSETDTDFGKLHKPVYELKALEGAEFDIIAAEDIVTPDGTVRVKKGDIVDHIVTGSGGKAVSKELFLGNYFAIETKAPDGFVLDTEQHPVSLVYADQQTAIVSAQVGVNNVRQRVEISLNKEMEAPIGAAEGFNPYADVVFGIFAGEEIQSIIEKDALVGIITPDGDGHGMFEGLLPGGQYYVREMQTNAYYQLNETIYPIEIAAADQDVSVIKVQVNDGEAIPNKLKLGKIVIQKQGETFVGATKTATGYTPKYELRGLQGVKFDIIDSSGKVVESLITGKDGKAESKLLPMGNYEVVETAAPAGFVLDAKRHAITLGCDGQVEEIVTSQVTVLNQRQKAEIKISKAWELPNDPPKDFAPWKEITFGLYAKADILAADGKVAIPANALIETIAIDEKGTGATKTDLPIGSYYVKEITTAKGYLLDETAHDLLFAGGKALTTLTVKAVNKLALGQITVLKIDAETEEPLEGAMFGLYQDEKLIAEAQSNADGIAVFSDIAFGDYELREISAPVGYQRDDTSHEVIIGIGNTQVELTFTNEKLPGEPIEPSEPEVPVTPSETPPRTGQDYALVKWCAVIGGLAFILAGFVLLRRKKHENEEK